MIARLLESVSARVGAADAVVKTDDTLTLAVSPDGETRLTRFRSQTSHLRVVREGRVGWGIGGHDQTDIADLVGRAMTSAVLGEELQLLLPGPAPVPEVTTRSHQTEAADGDGLAVSHDAGQGGLGIRVNLIHFVSSLKLHNRPNGV